MLFPKTSSGLYIIISFFFIFLYNVKSLFEYKKSTYWYLSFAFDINNIKLEYCYSKSLFFYLLSIFSIAQNLEITNYFIILYTQYYYYLILLSNNNEIRAEPKSR